jgi:hypothetical protein
MEKSRDIQNALLTYWKQDQDAADTLDAIASEWMWMVPREKVASALMQLVERGSVTVVSRTTGRLVYRCGRSAASRIEAANV